MIYEDLHLVPKFATAHGIEMGLAFAVFFPLGALSIRVLKFKGSIWVHVACQMIGYILMLGGLATGIRVGKIIDRLENNVHTILGTVIVVMMILQPFIGFIQHRQFRKTQSKSWWSHLHVWYGRLLICLGIVNGGLGLHLANNTTGGKITYGTIGGVVAFTYILGLAYKELKRSHDGGKPKSGVEGINLQRNVNK